VRRGEIIKTMTRKQKHAADYDITIIGAGPYGLSAASYLKQAGFSVRAFGEPMAFWAETMPEGMLLRSPRVASTIADPADALTLESYETATNTPPAKPVPLTTFVSYGRWFEQQLGGVVDRRNVNRVAKDNGHFELTLADGAKVSSHRLVVAAGVGAFQAKPTTFSELPAQSVSHCYEGRKVREFAGKRVAVIGAGQSALESAAILSENGADVEVIARLPELRWIGSHPWLHNLGPISAMLYSKHDIGPVGISRLVAYPNLVKRIPQSLRDKIGKRAVRPAGSQWLPPRLTSVRLTMGRAVERAAMNGHGVKLRLNDGSERTVDHVLLGTGYRVDLSRYEFLPASLVSQIRQLDGAPELSSGFTSSIPRLHFIGATAAKSYGPLMRFVTGTEFSSEHLTAHLLKNGNV
jgi:FAD-dependent urate hydroxylase